MHIFAPNYSTMKKYIFITILLIVAAVLCLLTYLETQKPQPVIVHEPIPEFNFNIADTVVNADSTIMTIRTDSSHVLIHIAEPTE